MKILHLITTLGVGGAEKHLLWLTAGQRARGHEPRVAYLKGEGRVFCILPKEDFESLRGAFTRPLHLLAEGGAGRRKDCLISNRPAELEEGSPAGSPGKDPGSPGPGARNGSGS